MSTEQRFLDSGKCPCSDELPRQLGALSCSSMTTHGPHQATRCLSPRRTLYKFPTVHYRTLCGVQKQARCQESPAKAHTGAAARTALSARQAPVSARGKTERLFVSCITGFTRAVRPGSVTETATVSGGSVMYQACRTHALNRCLPPIRLSTGHCLVIKVLFGSARRRIRNGASYGVWRLSNLTSAPRTHSAHTDRAFINCQRNPYTCTRSLHDRPLARVRSCGVLYDYRQLRGPPSVLVALCWQ